MRLYRVITACALLGASSLGGQETPFLVSPAERGVVLRWVWGERERPAGYFIERRPATGGSWTRLTPRPLTRSRDRAAARAVLGDRYDRYAGLLFPEDPRAERSDPEMFRSLLLLSADLEPGVAYLLGLRYEDVGAPAGAPQVYRLIALSTSGESVLATSGPVTAGTYRIAAGPAAITAVAGSRGASLRWKSEPRFSAYHVFRGTRRDGTNARALSDAPVVIFTRDEGASPEASATFFTDTTPPASDTTFYWVSGIDAFGRASRRSGPAAFVRRQLTSPSAPVVVQARIAGDTVVVTWLPPMDSTVARYQLWRAASDTGPFARVGPSVSTREQRDPGRPARRLNWYRVTALDAQGRESEPSAAAPAEVPDLTPPSPPDSVVVRADTGRMVLSWRQAAAPDLRGYRVYRANAANGTFGLLSQDLRRDASFVDTIRRKADHAFYYRVTAVDSSFNESAPSRVIAARPPDATPPSPPRLGEVLALDGALVVSWSANPEPDVSSYQPRLRPKGGAWTQLAALPATRTRDTIPDLEAGRTYEVSLVAIDDAGNSSAPASSVERAVRRRKLDRPDLRRATYDQRQRAVVVSWSAMNGVTQWLVLRRDEGGGALRPVAQVTPPTTQFVDLTVRTGRRYEYVIRARDAFGNIAESRARAVEIREARP